MSKLPIEMEINLLRQQLVNALTAETPNETTLAMIAALQSIANILEDLHDALAPLGR